MESKQCPKCGVANPPSRATCQACHTMLLGSINLNPLESAAPPPIPKHVPKKKTPSGKEIKEPVTKSKSAVRRTVKPAVFRSYRNTETGTRMFILDGEKLKTVIASLQMKKCKPNPSEKRIISLWNRNKSLFK